MDDRGQLSFLDMLVMRKAPRDWATKTSDNKSTLGQTAICKRAHFDILDKKWAVIRTLVDQAL